MEKFIFCVKKNSVLPLKQIKRWKIWIRERSHSILSSIESDENDSVRERFLVNEMVSTRTGIREEGRKHENPKKKKKESVEEIHGRICTKTCTVQFGSQHGQRFFSEFQVCGCSSSSSRRRSTEFERRVREGETQREREREGGGGDDGLEREGGDWEANKMSALTRTEKAHQKYREGKYTEALELYTDALNAASQVNHRVALHSNRAACHLKLQSYKQVTRRVVMYTLNVTYQALILTFQFLQVFVISFSQSQLWTY
jgi:hypothetical protein